jgi:peptidoglycan hydrolase CwlO-like protein
MDREQEILNQIQDLINIIRGMQKSIDDLTNAGFAMKQRIEALEKQVNQKGE